MDFDLTTAQKTLSDEIVRFAREHLNEGTVARDREQRFAAELWQRCGSLRLMGLPVPEALGGRGFDPPTCAVALEALGYGCLDAGLVYSVGAHLAAVCLP